MDTANTKTFDIGKVRIALVSAGTCWMDGGGVFGLVPRVLWEQVVQPDELNRIPTALYCLVIELAGKHILVDTGYGTKLSPKQREIYGLLEGDYLAASLTRLGLTPGDIDIVINTHLHFDHAGGNTTLHASTTVPTFPNAEYWEQRLEWADACYPNERTQATYLAENLRPVEQVGRLRLISGDTWVTSEVRCIVTRGHTRAHQSVLIESNGKRAMFLGDLASRTVQIEKLVWISAFDTEPLETLETKRAMQRWAVEAGALLFFEHDPEVPAGYLREVDGKFQVEPAV
jgi:glyoxylase-like metal-dependent hydrolase (beta-lactamase superfamily II)